MQLALHLWCIDLSNESKFQLHTITHTITIQFYKQGTYVACGTGKLFCEKKKKKSISKYIHIGFKSFNENFLASLMSPFKALH